jgi:two-component system, response regulator PdtaR
LKEGGVTPTDPLETPARGSITVLVAEDDVILRVVVTEQLRDEGYNVLEASNAEEVLLVLRTGARVDLLFTDVTMPGTLDGIGLARVVRAEFPAVKVVIASGNALPQGVGEAVDGFFAKPYHVPQLLGHIKALLSEQP